MYLFLNSYLGVRKESTSLVPSIGTLQTHTRKSGKGFVSTLMCVDPVNDDKNKEKMLNEKS